MSLVPYVGPAYHWSPTTRRASILRHGLVPGHARVTHTVAMPYLCFSLDEKTAWALSAGTGWTKATRFDLWRAQLIAEDGAVLDPPDVEPREVRTTRIIPPSCLTLILREQRTIIRPPRHG